MPSEHARLSPSASNRWIACPASIRMEESVGKDESSSFAEEGTVAHALAELEVRRQIMDQDVVEATALWRLHDAEAYDDETVADMHRHVQVYVDVIRTRLILTPDSALLLEQRVNTGVDSCWGTADAIIVSPTHIEAIDFKYGQGIRVNAPGNSQLRLYAVGALDTFGDVLGETETVTAVIVQPRLDHVSFEEITADELRTWREEVVRPAAAEALGPDAHFAPSADACRFCPAKGDCRARMLSVTSHDFAEDPDRISPGELADALTALPEIRQWCSAVEQTALHKTWSQGEKIPGWKVVMSGGRRRVTDETAAIQTLIDHGFPAEQVATFSLKGLGQLEKLVGREELTGVLGRLLVKSEGRPSMAPADSPKPEASPDGRAADEFREEPTD